MKHPATRELFAYWNGLRGERAAPERSEIDPSAIRNVLADTFMLEVDMTEGFPFRLAGTRVNGLFDSDLKGTSFVSLWRAEERRNVAAVLVTVADGACPVVAGGVAAPQGQKECAFEFLLLPLRHFGRTHSRILGLVKSAEKPDWLGYLPAGPITLRSLRIVDEASPMPKRRLDCATLVQPTQAAAGNVRAAQPFVLAESEQTLPGRPHLRLIKGGL